MLSADDVDYIASRTTSFVTGHLRVEDPDVEKDFLQRNGIDTENQPAFMDDVDIKKKLKGSAQSIKKWLDEVNDLVVLARVYDIAKESDLSLSKMEVIEAKMNM